MSFNQTAVIVGCIRKRNFIYPTWASIDGSLSYIFAEFTHWWANHLPWFLHLFLPFRLWVLPCSPNLQSQPKQQGTSPHPDMDQEKVWPVFGLSQEVPLLLSRRRSRGNQISHFHSCWNKAILSWLLFTFQNSWLLQALWLLKLPKSPCKGGVSTSIGLDADSVVLQIMGILHVRQEVL